MTILFLLRCPKCNNTMKYHTDTRLLAGKRKKCVYCPANFGVRDHLIKEL